MALTNPLQPQTYFNKAVLASIGGSYLVAVLYFGSLSKTHLKESAMDESVADAPMDKNAFAQEILTWTSQSCAMYYLVHQMRVNDPLKTSLTVGCVVGVFFNALPHYMRWRWVQEKSNKSLTAILIDCGGHVLFTAVQAYCIAKYS